MKVLSISPGFGKGGAERSSSNFALGYKKLNLDSRVLSTHEHDNGFRKNILLNEGIVVWMNNEHSIDEIIQWSPNFVHIQSNISDEQRLLELIDRLKQFGATIIEKSIFSYPKPYDHLLDYSCHLSNWALFLYLCRGGNSKKAKIIPNPVITDNFYKASELEILQFKNEHGIPKDSLIVGRIGQNSRGKRSKHFIDILCLFQKINPTCHYILVNPPKILVTYINLKKLENVHIIEKIDKDQDLRICYSAIDIFAHISNIGESFGNVLAECLLCETPVITLNTPWQDNSQAEVIGYRLGGECANSRKEFLNLLVKYSNSPELRKKKGIDGRKHILECFNYLNVCQLALDTNSSSIINRKKLSFNKLTAQQPFGIVKLILLSMFIFKNPKYTYVMGHVIRILKGHTHKYKKWSFT